MADVTQILPFSVYEPRNLGSTKAYVYLGKNISDGIKDFGTFAGDERTSENCSTVLLFASIVGGKQIRVDPWTCTDPHTFIDQRFYDLRPFRYLLSWEREYSPPENVKLQEYIDSLEGVVDETMPYNRSIHERGIAYLNNFDPVYYIRRLTSDGSVVINANNNRFWWGENAGENGITVNSNPDDYLKLEAHNYRVACEESVDVCRGDTICVIKDVKSDEARNGLTYTLRDLEPGKGVALFEYDRWINARDGLVFEDLSDLLPEGVHQISQWKECRANYSGNVLCPDNSET